MHSLQSSLLDSWWMLYATFWALVIGFSISGLIQAFGSNLLIVEKLGKHNPASVTRAGFLGAISSSCSYAASSIAKSLFDKGADFTTSMVFMFASTNLVFDLGLAIWALLGWKFAVAELFGGVLMIILLAIFLPLVVPTSKTLELRNAAKKSVVSSNSKPTLFDAAGFTMGDLMMLRFELVGGFLVAGFFDKLIPVSFWNAFFIAKGGVLAAIENALIGPIISAFSFVCSVGNIPLAAALWNKGISFGGTISFIFADLLTIPLILIYKKFFGTKITVRLVLVFWFVMSLSGLITQGLFKVLDATPMRMSMGQMQSHFANNRTTWLNAVALLVLIAVYITYKVGQRRPTSEAFAKDPICGMQVAVNTASAVLELDDETYYFCCDGCKQKFASQQSA